MSSVGGAGRTKMTCVASRCCTKKLVSRTPVIKPDDTQKQMIPEDILTRKLIPSSSFPAGGSNCLDNGIRNCMNGNRNGISDITDKDDRNISVNTAILTHHSEQEKTDEISTLCAGDLDFNTIKIAENGINSVPAPMVRTIKVEEWPQRTRLGFSALDQIVVHEEDSADFLPLSSRSRSPSDGDIFESVENGSGNVNQSSDDFSSSRAIRRRCATDTAPSIRCRRKTRSLYGMSPVCQFGPKATSNSAATVTIHYPEWELLQWTQRPVTVLLLQRVDTLILHKDVSCKDVAQQLLQFALWLIEVQQMKVYIEEGCLRDSRVCSLENFDKVKSSVIIFRKEVDNLTDKIDLVACLGSDSSLLDVSAIFQNKVPPVMAFHLDPVGFLSPLSFSNFRDETTRVLAGEQVSLTMRMRLSCSILKHGSIASGNSRDYTAPSSPTDISGHPLPADFSYQVLNEVMLERGEQSYLCHLDFHIDNNIVTIVQASGLLIATPTGSTAYAAATGSSMMHPNIPSVLITPICPHSLSFRPIIVPASVVIKVTLSSEALSNVWVSFDGRHRVQLCKGDELTIRSSRHPVPSICSQDQISDWFSQLADCLQWNQRKMQRSFNK